jgi:predicted nucleic acid-binding protein
VKYVIDAQAALGWLFEDEATTAKDQLLESLKGDGEAYVPSLFGYEIANVLKINETKKSPRLTQAQSDRFLDDLSALPVFVDAESTRQAWSRTIALARQHDLTAYDAAYLELALRLSLPLATEDSALVAAAKTAGVRLLL